jgi:hypothetical protein
MASNLYTQARASLGDPTPLQESEAWLAAQIDGNRLLSNLRKEAHLVGAAAFGDVQAFAGFLQLWVSFHIAAATDAERRDGYERACKAHEMHGSRVDPTVRPARLLRYLTSRTVLATIISRVLGRDAKVDFNNGDMSVADAFSRLEARWSNARFQDDDRLGRGDTIFATFEHSRGAPRDNATEMVKALALPAVVASRVGDDFLYEFSYLSKLLGNLCIPTVADAGWFPLFEPAPEVRPDPVRPETCCGWTKPVGPQQPQPEVVHANAPMELLMGAPQLIGRIFT